MQDYPHKVAGVYTEPEELAAARELFRQAGFDEAQLRDSCALGEPGAQAAEPDDRGVRDDALKSLGLGFGVGAGAGVAAAVAVGAALPVLYATLPVMGPLAVAGYGAFVGTTVGGIRGLRLKDSEFAAMLQDAIREGCCVLVVHCRDEAEQTRAGELLDRSVAQRQAQGRAQ